MILKHKISFRSPFSLLVLQSFLVHTRGLLNTCTYTLPYTLHVLSTLAYFLSIILLDTDLISRESLLHYEVLGQDLVVAYPQTAGLSMPTPQQLAVDPS